MTDALNNLCDLVAHITGAQAAVIAQQDLKSKTIKVRGRVGTLVSEVDMTFVLPEMSYEKAPLLIVPDIRSDSRFQNHPLLKLMPHLKSLTAMLIPVPPLSGRAVLKIINPRRSAMLDGVVMQILSYACATASAVLRMAEAASSSTVLRAVQPELLRSAIVQPSRAGAEMLEETGPNQDIAAKFLLETLVKKRVLHTRNGSDYVTLRTWRKAIKPYQIAALIAVKTRPPSEFVAQAAREIAESVRQSHGEGTIGSVVPVPPGNSTIADSLARQLAEQVAELIGGTYCDVLENKQTVKRGKSSPYKSAALAPYRPVAGLKSPILIVDDVASSGRHLELAINALKTPSTPAYAIAWIGQS